MVDITIFIVGQLSKPESVRDIDPREELLASLSRILAAPSHEWPTVRVWTKSSFDLLLRKVRGDAGKPGRAFANQDFIDWLQGLGLAWTIRAEPLVFYLLEIGAGPSSRVDPLELMMACEPRGVICYFSALAFHSLTSQMPSHHHVARIMTPSTERILGGKPAGEGGIEPPPGQGAGSGGRKAAKSANPFGKVAFTYLDVPCHLTRRAGRLVPGVQDRSDGPRGRLRVTTYEQTLLDTLHKPRNCGGPAVVLEAWQGATGSGEIDEERLTEYLIAMDYPSTTRRVGAMLQMLEYGPGPELRSFLDRAREAIDRAAPHSRISLLPGFDYANLDPEWLVNLP